MNGAQALLRTLLGGGVDVCFGNPGTSEMHFVSALDTVPRMRAVLGLSEGVVTGAADGYGRMTGRPAATLLHLGPGLANGMANLHNARRARTPVVNVVGDHALWHKPFDAPLESDIDAAARTVSAWVHRSLDAASVGADTAEAIAAASAPPGQVATLILPADVSWSEGASAAPPATAATPASAVSENALVQAVTALRSRETTTLLLGGAACRERGLRAASRIAAATGARVLLETFPARVERGWGLPGFECLAYPPDMASAQLAGCRHLVLAGARDPVSFFAYPDRPSRLAPGEARIHVLAEPAGDVPTALEALADEVAGGDRDASAAPGGAEPSYPPHRPMPTGPLTVRTWAEIVGSLLPERAVVCDEANTSGAFAWPATAASAPHDWLRLTGGAIGQGLPLAVGAAVACPDRPVVCLEADGSAMYTIAALWTMARESLDVTTVVLSNRSYAILRGELQRVGADSVGPKAEALLDLSRPDLDFVALAHGMGVPATRAHTGEELAGQFAAAVAEPGPRLIEALVPPLA